jgi:hypothetical protein
MGSFHFVNRIADLLGVPPETLPRTLRRFEFLRRLAIRLGSVLMAKMDLAIAVAEANQWARVHRLFGLDPELFYMSTGVKL